ncbi:MAG: amidase family protein, partial [Myxococcota bacterium]
MTDLNEYESWDATDMAAHVRNGEVTPTELLDAALRRVEARNGELNAVVHLHEDRARRAIALGLPDGPLRGVPFMMKDITPWESAPLTMGSNLLRDNRADHSHPWVRRLEAAGAVIFAQTNTPEFGLLPLTEPTLHGPTKNPWKTTHSPGGSSGGSAAAVAARMVPMAHANDGGGSIRIPAACCGLFGLKPSRGRNPASVYDPPDGYTAEHVVSRTVRDSALVLDITHGARAADRWALSPPEARYVEGTAQDPPRLKIAFSIEDHRGRRAHPDCAAAVEQVARLCEELGHTVVEAAPEIDGDAFDAAFEVLWSSAAGLVFSMSRQRIRESPLGVFDPIFKNRRLVEQFLHVTALRTRKRALEPFTTRLAQIEASYGPADVFLAWQQFQRTAETMTAFFDDYDVVLCPVLGEPPWPTGSLDQRAPIDDIRARLQRYAAFTLIANVIGLPAMSVPLGTACSGLPTAAHFSAP